MRIVNLSLALALIIFGYPSLLYAEDKGILYHCPSYKDIQYKDGQFQANTKYNNLEINWFSTASFREENRHITGFLFLTEKSCIGGKCEISCVYKTDNKPFSLSIRYGEYMAKINPSTNSVSHNCSQNPETCEFTLIKEDYLKGLLY